MTFFNFFSFTCSFKILDFKPHGVSSLSIFNSHRNTLIFFRKSKKMFQVKQQ